MSDVSTTPSRLQTRLNALLDQHPFGNPWLASLWQQAAATRPGVALSLPTVVGDLVEKEAPTEHAARAGRMFDRPLAPAAEFLRWLLEHPAHMTVADRDTFGAKDAEVRAWRRRLFSDDATDVASATAEGVRQLSSRLAQRGRNKWWLFEGFARVDACLVTEHAVVVVERWRDDLLTSSSRWYPDRVQLWRDVEATQEFAADRAFGVILLVDDSVQGDAALAAADASMARSFPHLGVDDQQTLARHLLGYVGWRALE